VIGPCRAVPGDQQAQLIGVVVVVAIEPDVESPRRRYQLLEDGDSIEDGGKLFGELLRHGDLSWTVDDDHGEGELTDNTSKTHYLDRGQPMSTNDWRQ